MPRWNYTDDGFIEVWTDGACSMNGRKGAKAGLGVFFGDDNHWNLSEPVIGRVTSNSAEIQAVTRACCQARAAGKRRLHIYTDSEFVINCETKWIDTWRQRNWINASNRPVVNRKELEEMDHALGRLQAYRLEHVRGHRGTYGNEQADELARSGAQRYVDEQYDYSSSDDSY